MITRRVEYVIFLIVLIVLAVVFSGLTTEIKLNHAPYNEGLSPEQVIEKELQITVNGNSSEYRYKIISNSLFAVVESGVDAETLHIGYKNNVSGFSFDDFRNIFRKYETIRFFTAPDGELLWVTVTHIVNDYAIYVKDLSHLFSDTSFIIKDQSGQGLEKIEAPGGNAYWIIAFENIPDDFQLMAEYGNESTVILDKKEILNFFGGRL